MQAQARELTEDTGWKLAQIETQIADWKWEWDGMVRRKVDYLVTVTDKDQRLRDIVVKAVRIRLTGQLPLEPVEPSHTDDLVRLHDDDTAAFWYTGR